MPVLILVAAWRIWRAEVRAHSWKPDQKLPKKYQLYSPNTYTKLYQPCLKQDRDQETQQLQRYLSLPLSWQRREAASFLESLCVILNIPACKMLDEDTQSWVSPTYKQYLIQNRPLPPQIPLRSQSECLNKPTPAPFHNSSSLPKKPTSCYYKYYKYTLL